MTEFIPRTAMPVTPALFDAALNDLEDRSILPAANRYPTQAALPTAFNEVRQNTTGSHLFMSLRAGVVSAPGQNGHIYFEVSHDNSQWRIWDYVACRNESGNGGPIGTGKGLFAMVPAGYYYRLRTATIAGFATPTFVLDSPQWMSYCQIA